MNNDEFVEMMEALPISASFIETIAISQSFLVRKGSISPMDFLYALCCLSTGGTVSFNDMAAKIDAGTAVSVSRQAIARKMGKISCTAFLKKILALCIIGRIGRKVEDRDNLQVVEKQYGFLQNSYGVTKSTVDNTVCQIYHDNHLYSIHIFSGKKNNTSQNEKTIKHAQSGEIPDEKPCKNAETDERNKTEPETARQSTTATGKVLFL